MVRWPWGSRSIRRTRFPSSASAHPRFTAVVVLPTPPFWLATAMTLLKRVLDLCAGTWLRLFNGNTAAQSSSALWTRRGGPGKATPLNGRRGLDSEGGHPSLWNVAAAMDPGRGWRTLGVERQRREELRRLARRGRVLEAGREPDQDRVAEGGAHKGNADRNPKREAHRHVDDRVADDGRGRRAAEDKVIAIDQVSGPGGRIGWRNERVQMVLAQQQIDALGRAKQGVLSQRLVVRESQRLNHVSGVGAHRERLGQIEDLLGEERHLLVGVRAVEVDGVLQRMDRHAAAPGKVFVEVCLEVVEQNRELSGAIVDVADVWEGQGVDQYRTSVMHRGQRRFEDIIRVRAESGIIPDDPDPSATQPIGIE